uniref:Uncharacterized protein n=1 Tax=Meloidogyne enterolobii TaxID=390850 RepID=A0A6V7U7Y4_MELEN|nr:unnamed protein product [Meloidogyne enterolobii]
MSTKSIINLNNPNNKTSLFKQIYWVIPPFLAFLIFALLLLALLTAIIGLILPTFLIKKEIKENNFEENLNENCLNNSSFLWLINATWLNSPSFLFGTIHVPYNKIWEDNKSKGREGRCFVFFK